MKRTRLAWLFAAIASLFVVPARAQVNVADLPDSRGGEEAFDVSLVDEYRAAQARLRPPAWWKGIEDEISIPSNLPYAYVLDSDLQLLILFAQLHGDKLDLSSSLPPIIDTYRRHPDTQLRVMALVALHAIGREEAFAAMEAQLPEEVDSRVRHMTKAALAERP